LCATPLTKTSKTNIKLKYAYRHYYDIFKIIFCKEKLISWAECVHVHKLGIFKLLVLLNVNVLYIYTKIQIKGGIAYNFLYVNHKF
jgi:hypothetical protein